MHRLFFVLRVIEKAVFACIAVILVWRSYQSPSPGAMTTWVQPVLAPAPCRSSPGEGRRWPVPRLSSVSILSPQSGATVPQWGASVRFRLEGELPVGTRPVIFLRDGTGLDTNFWAWDAYPTDVPGEWEAHVQFGEAADSGARFALAVLVLRDQDCPPCGTVGFLPAHALARSEIVEVIRK